MVKTRKSIIKRFKITKTGKIFRRATGLDHYIAKIWKEDKKKQKMDRRSQKRS